MLQARSHADGPLHANSRSMKAGSAKSSMAGPAKMGRVFLVTGLGVLLLFGIAAALLIAKWPFTRAKLLTVLQDRSGRAVMIQRYQTTYFPPGCIAEGISFLSYEHEDKPPMISLKKLVVRATWAELLTFQHKIPEVDAYGMQILIPPRGEAAEGKTHAVSPLSSRSSGNPVSIGRLFVHGAALDFLPGKNGKGSFHLDLLDLKLFGVGGSEPFHYETVL
jgi:hypothetical protein